MSARAGTRAVVRTSEDKRFRRAQPKASWHRRRERLARWGRAARTLAVTVVVTAGVWAAWRAVMDSPQLRVRSISVRGAGRLAPGEIVALVDGMRGQHILRVDLEAWRQRVLASPWVEDAVLHRELPATIVIDVVERQPLAIGRVDDELYVMDARGGVIDEFGPQYADLDLPVVDGLGGLDGNELRRAVELTSRLLASLGPHEDLLRRVSQVDVSDPHDAVVVLEGDPARLHLGETAFVERLRSYLELGPALRSRVPAMDAVDLRFGTRVFVQPARGASGGERPAAAAGAGRGGPA